MKAPLTREKYKARFAKFLDFVDRGDGGNSLEDRARAFAEKSNCDSNWAFANILKFIQFQKDRVDKKEIAAATIRNYRKWFKTRCEIAGMKPINIEKLMNHSTGISDSYYRATEQ
jgi:hypothetical protein